MKNKKKYQKYTVSKLIKNTQNSPWAWLGMTRKQWDKEKLWKKSGKSKAEYTAFILSVPQEALEIIRESNNADRLIEKIF